MGETISKTRSRATSFTEANETIETCSEITTLSKFLAAATFSVVAALER